jgi:hypothetical protein
MQKRAEDRKYHFTYKVTCSYNGRVFYGVHSTDEIDQKFTGKGNALRHSVLDYGVDAHKLEIICVYPTRAEAKANYNELKSVDLISPRKPEDRKHHIVYKTTRFDGKYYIGVHSTDDLDDRYMGSGTYIGRSLKKHGREKHSFEILFHCVSRTEAFENEAKLVNEEILNDVNCMNQQLGGNAHGDRIYGFTDETLKKISEASKRNWQILKDSGYQHPKPSQEAITKRAAKNTGKKRTEEQLANLSSGLQKYHATVDPVIIQERAQRAAQTRLDRGTNLGGRPKGTPMSEEQKLAQSLRTKGKSLSEKHKLNLKKPKTRICCLHCQKETTTSHLPRYHLTCG